MPSWPRPPLGPRSGNGLTAPTIQHSVRRPPRSPGTARGEGVLQMSTADVSRTDSSAAPVLRYDPTAQYEVETFDVEYRRDADQPWLARIYRPRGSRPFP